MAGHDGAEVHLDGTRSGEGDCFKVYDVCQYLETSGRVEECDITQVSAVLERLVGQGQLERLGQGYYRLAAYAA
ncbi:DUF6896 domain-containing protein [Streptomyces specialis]|uniref:DUF6896 domain-containing protein n=1 Tax=Streptomyces specialis TaxID=498367 RepID=UPI003899EE29